MEKLRPYTQNMAACPHARWAILLLATLVSTHGGLYAQVEDIFVPGRDFPIKLWLPTNGGTSTSMPLLVELHGGTFSGNLLGFREPARQAGFLYVAPTGDCPELGWNIKLTYSKAGTECDDHSIFLRNVIDEIKRIYPVDPNRIYLTGTAGGATMAVRMACDHADLLAGIAQFQAIWSIEEQRHPCRPTHPVHMLNIYGDPARIQFLGTQIVFSFSPELFFQISGKELAEMWVGFNGGSLETEAGTPLDNSTILDEEETTVTRYLDGMHGQVEIWTIAGEENRPAFTDDFYTNVLDWFLQHPKGGSVPVETEEDEQPILPQAFTVTPARASASSSFGSETTPEKTIDGSGLVNEQHGTHVEDMWLSEGVPAWIQYEFDRPYRLDKLRIWNSNQAIEPSVGFGAKDVVIERSLNGVDWIPLEGISQLAQATGSSDYLPHLIDLPGIAAQHLRITINDNHGLATRTGLSEVQFSYLPTFAADPYPKPLAVEVTPDLVLSWNHAGLEAARHDVYLGLDAGSLSLVGSVSASSFDTKALDLQLGETYFWRVDEVNEAMEPSRWQGEVWEFSTVDFLVVDDMEQYGQDESQAIWWHWVDGLGDPTNGSRVGANPQLGDLAPNKGIVNYGRQSLAIHIDNSLAEQSEATRAFDPPQDWTRFGVQSLVLSINVGQLNSSEAGLYIKVNDTRIHYPDLAALPPGWDQWLLWEIDLPSLGADLTGVETLTIGVEGADVKGVLNVDDIRLYRDPPLPQPQLIDWFEAESGIMTVPLDVFVDDANASANQYIGTIDGTDDSFTDPPVDGIASYSFTVPEDGVYRLALRVIARPGHDSFWVRIPGMGTNTAIHSSGWVRFNDILLGDTWHWDVVHSNNDWDRVVDFSLSAGTHTLEIAHRENGTLLDAIAVIR